MTNVKLAFRRLIKTPFVTSVAVISLALGIGANAAIFSLFNQLLLAPLPVPHPEQLVNFAAPGPKPGSTSCNQAGDCDEVFSFQMFKDLERVQTSFAGIAAHCAFGANLAFQGQTLNADGMLVSGSYFPVLGIQPAVGRLLGPDDDKTIGGGFVVVLGYNYWLTHLAANPGVVGRPLVVNGQSMTIIGVAPRGFEGTTLGTTPAVYVPLTMRALVIPGWKGFEARQNYWAYLFARLKPGVTLEQARAALNVPYHAIVNDVEAPLQKGMSDQTLARFKAKTLGMEAGQRGQSDLHRNAQAPLTLLMAITGIVLVIACANIANLLLARAAGRASEMAVRLSIGASRGQLLAQLLTESIVLAVIGGAGGLVVAHWTLDLIASLLPPESMAALQFAIDWHVVVFVGAVALATGVLFGLFPALHSTRPDLMSTLKGQAGQPSGHRGAARFRTSLVTAQIALSMALLISAGLFVKSLVNVSRVDLGLKADDVVTFALSAQLNGYDEIRLHSLYERVERELAAIPGVAGVSAATVPLMAGSNWNNDVHVQGFHEDPDTDNNASFNKVGPGYFHTLGMTMLAGREFTAADAADAPKVVVVNQAFAEKFNLGRDAVGKHMSTHSPADLDMEIVGIVKNAKYSDVKRKIPPVFYIPYKQDDRVGTMYFYVHTAMAPDALMKVIPAAVARLDPNLPVENLKTLPQQIRENVFLDRMISTLAAAFALLATILAAVGLYGVLAYTVTQRTREIGLRMALGADGGRVRGMVMRQVGWMTLVGGAVGVVAAVALGRFAASLLFELQSGDPIVIISSAAALAVVALGAGYLPARRASRVEPMQALRYE